MADIFAWITRLTGNNSRTLFVNYWNLITTKKVRDWTIAKTYTPQSGNRQLSSGQIVIFHQPRFPWNSRGFPFLSYILGILVVWGRELIWPDLNIHKICGPAGITWKTPKQTVWITGSPLSPCPLTEDMWRDRAADKIRRKPCDACDTLPPCLTEQWKSWAFST